MFRLESLENKVPMEFLCIPELGTVPGTCQTLSRCWMNWIPNHWAHQLPILSARSSLIPRQLRESCRAAWCLAHRRPLTNVYWRIRHMMRITRQSLSDKLLINNSWSPGVLSQEVRVCRGSPWCAQGLPDIEEATAMFAAHATWPGWVWVWGGLFWFSAFVTCSSFSNTTAF